MSFILGFFSKTKVAMMLLTAVLEGALAIARAKWPNATLPSAEQVLALGGGLIACHTVTDVVALIKDAILAYAQTPRATPK
jgi:hypothetical protein